MVQELAAAVSRSMAMAMAVKMCSPTISNSSTQLNPVNIDRLQSRFHVKLPSEEASFGRRLILNCGAVSLVECLLIPSLAWANDESEEDKNESVIGSIKSLFDPNEKTKAGRVLPKAYLQSARELVKTLRESLKEDPKDMAKFRRTADAAKGSIREYLNGWRGEKTVVNEESYAMLEKAIRALASFYSKAGPSAALPEEIKSEILGDLDRAEEFL